MTVTPIPVDRDGIDVVALGRSGAEAVVVTPAHQFPTGALLSASRRAALIAWAEQGDRLIIEDDHDTELCRGRVGALQGLAPDRVLHIGSASSRLAPGMRLGWMLPPSWLSWALISAKAIEDAGSEITGQLALADFIQRGEFEAHLRRMRLRYEHRRLASWPRSRTASRGGLGGVGRAVPARRAVQGRRGGRAADRGGASRRRSSTDCRCTSYAGEQPPALVLGYAHLAKPALTRSVELLGHAGRTAAPAAALLDGRLDPRD